MKRTLFSLIFIATFFLAACAPKDAALREVVPVSVPPVTYGGGVAQTSVDFAGEAGAPANAPMAADATVAEGYAANQLADGLVSDRLVIKNVNLSLVVDDTTTSVDAISQLAESMGGFVVALNTFQTTYGPEAKPAQQANLTIRVPSEKLNEVLKQIKGLAVEVRSENISGQDVTSEYTDLKSRLTNLEAAEKQLQSIMEEAIKTEDVLAVYNQLVYTREQIEVIKGQMKYYEESAALSAVSIELIPNVVTQPIEVGGWQPQGAAKQAIEDTIRFLQDLTDNLIYFGIAYLPFLLIVGLPAFLIGRAAWKRMSKKSVSA